MTGPITAAAEAGDRLTLARELLLALARQFDEGIPARELAGHAKRVVDLADELHAVTPTPESAVDRILGDLAERGTHFL